MDVARHIGRQAASQSLEKAAYTDIFNALQRGMGRVGTAVGDWWGGNQAAPLQQPQASPADEGFSWNPLKWPGEAGTAVGNWWGGENSPTLQETLPPAVPTQQNQAEQNWQGSYNEQMPEIVREQLRHLPANQPQDVESQLSQLEQARQNWGGNLPFIVEQNLRDLGPADLDVPGAPPSRDSIAQRIFGGTGVNQRDMLTGSGLFQDRSQQDLASLWNKNWAPTGRQPGAQPSRDDIARRIFGGAGAVGGAAKPGTPATLASTTPNFPQTFATPSAIYRQHYFGNTWGNTPRLSDQHRVLQALGGGGAPPASSTAGGGGGPISLPARVVDKLNQPPGGYRPGEQGVGSAGADAQGMVSVNPILYDRMVQTDTLNDGLNTFRGDPVPGAPAPTPARPPSSAPPVQPQMPVASGPAPPASPPPRGLVDRSKLMRPDLNLRYQAPATASPSSMAGQGAMGQMPPAPGNPFGIPLPKAAAEIGEKAAMEKDAILPALGAAVPWLARGAAALAPKALPALGRAAGAIGRGLFGTPGRAAMSGMTAGQMLPSPGSIASGIGSAAGALGRGAMNMGKDFLGGAAKNWDQGPLGMMGGGMSNMALGAGKRMLGGGNRSTPPSAPPSAQLPNVGQPPQSQPIPNYDPAQLTELLRQYFPNFGKSHPVPAEMPRGASQWQPGQTLPNWDQPMPSQKPWWLGSQPGPNTSTYRWEPTSAGWRRRFLGGMMEL